MTPSFLRGLVPTPSERNLARFSPIIAQALSVFPTPLLADPGTLQASTYVIRLREAVRFIKAELNSDASGNENWTQESTFSRLSLHFSPSEFLRLWPKISVVEAQNHKRVRIGPRESATALPIPSGVPDERPPLSLSPTSEPHLISILDLIEAGVLPPLHLSIPDETLQSILGVLCSSRDVFLEPLKDGVTFRLA